MAQLEPLLGALGARGVERLEDLADLLGACPPESRVLLDLGELDSGDAGILRRFQQRHPDCSLELIGGDPTRSIVQLLTLEGRARWSPWPLDTDRLASWARGAQGDWAIPDQGKQATARPSTPRDLDVLAIERILGGEDIEVNDSNLEPFGIESPEAPPSGIDEAKSSLQPPKTPPQQSNPERTVETQSPVGFIPPWYRDQVADLADMAQRLDLGLRRTLEASEEAESDDALRSLSDDISRLGQFTRTIGYLAAPPGPDGSSVDLSELAQDYLSSLAHEDDGGPRYLFRAAPDAVVRAEKGLLVLSIDAVLTVASLAAGTEGEVKVGVSVKGTEASLEVIFPAGPLGDLERAQWLEPYALHRLLPGVGPNAIPAAAAILAGQGGQLTLSGEGDERTFRLDLPLA